MKECFTPILFEKNVLLEDGSVLASPLTKEEALFMGTITEESFFAPVYITGATTSTFDFAWHCANACEIPPWAGFLAASQTNGRGQLRREWISPPGNLYVSFFLPPDIARLGDMASIAVGSCVLTALCELGIETRLKWPNDLLLYRDGLEGKFGGLLLEERGGRFLAGLGLNCHSAPNEGLLRENKAVPAIALPIFDDPLFFFWKKLAASMCDVYEHHIQNASLALIRQWAESCLAWKGMCVQSEDEKIVGVLTGIDMNASLLVQTNTGLVAISSGSISPVLCNI